MAFELPFGVKVLNPIPVEYYYSKDGIPYDDQAEANSYVPSSVRYIGLTVNIMSVEYWYKDGLLNINLVMKNTASSAEYLHTQAIANTTWNVQHNLNKKAVVVQVFDVNGREYKADISHTDNNNTVISLGFNLSGYAQFL